MAVASVALGGPPVTTLAAEIQARKDGDAKLQSQIDALTARVSKLEQAAVPAPTPMPTPAPTPTKSPPIVGKSDQTYTDLEITDTTLLGSAFTLTGLTNVRLVRPHIRGFRLGIYATKVSGLTIEDPDIADCDYAGIAAFSCDHLTVTGGSISRIGFTKDPATGFQGNNAYGVMLNRSESANVTTDPPCSDCLIQGVSIADVPLWQGVNAHAGTRVQITDNHIEGCPRGIFIAGSPTPAGTQTLTHPLSFTIARNSVTRAVQKTGGAPLQPIMLAGLQGDYLTDNKVGTSYGGTAGAPYTPIVYTGEGNGPSSFTQSGNVWVAG